MQTKKQEYFWEPCLNFYDEATVDIEATSTNIDREVFVELTREDLESMLSALDDLEAD